MRATDRIIRAIKNFEGLKLTPYKDSAGVLTIGYGHTDTANQYTKITPALATRLLWQDLSRFEKLLNTYRQTRGYELNQNQFDALLSFVYNVGSIKAGSNLDKALRAKDKTAAARSLSRYVYAGNTILKGLQTRRNYETQLFLTPHYDLKILLAVPFLL